MLINHYYKFPLVTEGIAKSTEDVFNILIRNQFENKAQIIAQHKALMEYVKQPAATYFVRLHYSAPKDKYQNLRRGFLSQYADGNKIVFCDNTFALNFTAAKAAGILYNVDEVNKFLNQKQMVYSFGTTSIEKELSYYDPKGAKRQNINPAGWTLAHIKPVGYGFNGEKLINHFPNPDRQEWNPDTRIRLVDSKLSETELTVARAHFLRLVHPLNSFLVPKNNLVQYVGKRLGEETDLINFVYQYLKEEFPAEMEELESFTMQYEFPESTSLGEIKWYGPENLLKTPVKEIEQLIDVDDAEEIFEEESSLHLHKALKRIGMMVFRDYMYPVFKDNINASKQDIINHNPDYSKYAESSIKTHISQTRFIFNTGLEEEALEIIANSKIN